MIIQSSLDYLPLIFRNPHLTAMVFDLQKFNFHPISCLFSPSLSPNIFTSAKGGR